jgi:hypothetical protein
LVNTINVSQARVFPEWHVQTDLEGTLATGETDLFDIKNPSPNQIIVPLSFAVDQVTNVLISQKINNRQKPSIYSTGPYIQNIAGTNLNTGNDTTVSAHEMGFAQTEFKLQANNQSGASVASYKSRMSYLVDAYTTARKIADKVNLSKYPIGTTDPMNIASMINRDTNNLLSRRDVLAIKNLWQNKKIDFFKKMLIGVNVPPNWDAFIDSHETIDEEISDVKQNLTVTLTDTKAITRNVDEGTVITLESIMNSNPTASPGQDVISITRDLDLNYIQVDPALLSTVYPTLFHIHAFDQLVVDAKTSGTENAFNIKVGISIRRPGLAFRVKMLEFSPASLPSSLYPTESEERIVQEESLADIARLGIAVFA